MWGFWIWAIKLYLSSSITLPHIWADWPYVCCWLPSQVSSLLEWISTGFYGIASSMPTSSNLYLIENDSLFSGVTLQGLFFQNKACWQTFFIWLVGFLFTLWKSLVRFRHENYLFSWKSSDITCWSPPISGCILIHLPDIGLTSWALLELDVLVYDLACHPMTPSLGSFTNFIDISIKSLWLCLFWCVASFTFSPKHLTK